MSPPCYFDGGDGHGHCRICGAEQEGFPCLHTREDWLSWSEAAAALAATWTNGPGSEAARAARGEGAGAPMLRATVLRWMADRFEFEANLPEVSGQTFAFGHLRTASIQGANLWAARKLRELADSDLLKRWPEKANPRPDPAHVPAVRRVVAWETHSRELSRSAGEAYDNAAYRMIRLAWSADRRSVSTLPSWRRWLEFWSDDRIEKLAAWLRHRDEKAGCR